MRSVACSGTTDPGLASYNPTVLEAPRRSPIVDAEVFDRAEGRELMDAPAVVLKGVLESEVVIGGLLV